MVPCVYCKTETEMYEVGDVPLCIECSDCPNCSPITRKPTEPQIHRILNEQLEEAIEHAVQASEVFFVVVTEIPSGHPRRDGTERINDASRGLSLARAKMAAAQRRLNDYVNRGIVPEDLRNGNYRSDRRELARTIPKGCNLTVQESAVRQEDWDAKEVVERMVPVTAN